MSRPKAQNNFLSTARFWIQDSFIPQKSVIACIILATLAFNPTEVPIDNYFGKCFIVGGYCLQWYMLAIESHYFGKVVDCLLNLRQRDVDDRQSGITRLTQFAIEGLILCWIAILLLSMMHLHWNTEDCCLFSVTIIFKECVAALYKTYIFFTFQNEFLILELDFYSAINGRNSDEFRTCDQRHQKLLEVANLFRDKLKLFLWLALKINFFVILICCKLLASKLKTTDNYMFYTMISLLTAKLCVLLYGFYCGHLELKVLLCVTETLQ